MGVTDGTQRNPQGKRTRIRSPKSGAEVACGRDSPGSWKPGQSGNPEGSTRRQRLERALDQVIDDPTALEIVKRLAADAKSRKGRALGLKATELLAKTAGLMQPEAEQHVVHVQIGFRDRSSGAVSELEVMAKDEKREEGVEL